MQVYHHDSCYSKSVDFIKLQRVCENQNCCSLIFADLLQLVEITYIKLVNKKSWQSTCIKPVDNLQQTCYHQAGASNTNASWYQVDDCKGTNLLWTCRNLHISGHAFYVYIQRRMYQTLCKQLQKFLITLSADAKFWAWNLWNCMTCLLNLGTKLNVPKHCIQIQYFHVLQVSLINLMSNTSKIEQWTL